MADTVAKCVCGELFAHRLFSDTRGRYYCSAMCAEWACGDSEPQHYWNVVAGKEGRPKDGTPPSG